MQLPRGSTLWVCCLLTFAGSISAGVSISVPLAGFLQRGTVDIRPVTGLPGANLVETPIPLDQTVRRVFVAPGQNFALIETLDQKIGLAALTPSGLGSFSPVIDTAVQVDRIAFSPTGQSALLYSKQLQKISVLAGLPDKAQVVRQIDTSAFPSAPSQIAVSDDGQILLASFAAPTPAATASLARIESKGELRTLLSLASVSSIRFLRQSANAIIADGRANQVFLLGADSSKGLSARLLAGAAQDVSTAIDVESSSDGARAFILNSATANVLMIDTVTGQSDTFPCGFTPFAFQRLTNSTVAILSEDGESVSTLDTDAVSPWVSFAPKAR